MKQNSILLSKNWNELHEKVQQPNSLLFWSIPAFLRAWRRMPLGKGNEDFALEQRRALVKKNNVPQRYTLDAFLDACWAGCGENERNWDILQSRCGFDGELKTLASIALRYGLTRERVRQIQDKAYRSLGRAGGIIRALDESFVWLLKQEGGVASISDIKTLFEQYFACGEVPAEAVFELLSRLYSNTTIYTPNDNPLKRAMSPTSNTIVTSPGTLEKVLSVLDMACNLWVNRETPLYSDKWVKEVVDGLRAAGNPIKATFVQACLRADGRFDPDLFDYVDIIFTVPKALERTLQGVGEPIHFTEIARRLNEIMLLGRPVNERSVHSCLCAHPELFVCVGPGIYGLLAWGLENQRVTRERSTPFDNLIVEFLQTRQEPAKASEIADYVMQKKKCKRASVLRLLATQKRLFERVAIGVYGLANAKVGKREQGGKMS